MNDMPAGRELDALISEKVMGLKEGVDFGKWDGHVWKLCKDGEIDTFAYESDYCNGPQCERCGYGYCHHCQDEPDEPCEVEPPPYSTSLSRAWEVVNKLNLLEDTSSMLYKNDEGLWAIGQLYWEWIEDEFTAETVPLVICRAALKAVSE